MEIFDKINFGKKFQNSKKLKISRIFLTTKKSHIFSSVTKMSDAFYYQHGGFAPRLETGWERFCYATRYATEHEKNLAVILNDESSRGTVEQTENVFR